MDLENWMDEEEFEELRALMIQQRADIRNWPDRVVEKMARKLGVEPEKLLPILRQEVNEYLASRLKENPIPTWTEMVERFGVDRKDEEGER